METTGIVNDIVNEIVTCGRVFSLSLFSTGKHTQSPRPRQGAGYK